MNGKISIWITRAALAGVLVIIVLVSAGCLPT